MVAQCPRLLNVYIDGCLIWWSISVDRAHVGSAIVLVPVPSSWSRCGCLRLCRPITPEWTLECHSNIIASLLASLAVVTAGRLSLFLHPQHPFHSISAFETKSEFGWKPWQWLVTTAVTRHHSHHSTGQSFCRQLQNHSVFLHRSLKNVSLYGFYAFLFCKV